MDLCICTCASLLFLRQPRENSQSMRRKLFPPVENSTSGFRRQAAQLFETSLSRHSILAANVSMGTPLLTILVLTTNSHNICASSPVDKDSQAASPSPYFQLIMAVRNSVFCLHWLSLPANWPCTQRGDDALAGREETNIPSHRFPPEPSQSRTICFKGVYLSIINQETKHRKTFEENVTEYKEFEVPAGYTCYIRGASVFFKL